MRPISCLVFPHNSPEAAAREKSSAHKLGIWGAQIKAVGWQINGRTAACPAVSNDPNRVWLAPSPACLLFYLLMDLCN
jgi:hypothetical protein